MVVLLINIFIVETAQLSTPMKGITQINSLKTTEKSSPRAPQSTSNMNVTFHQSWSTAWPFDIAINSTGYVYVTDISPNNRVNLFTSNGTSVTNWGGIGTGDGQFDNPRGIAINSTGYVYVSDSNNDRVQVFTNNGTFIRKWGSTGSGDGQLDSPRGIAINATGDVYVAEGNNHRVQVFTSNGTFIRKWGSTGSGDGQFTNPSGITIDKLGYVYVTDSNNDRVQVFTNNGTFVRKWGSTGSGDGQFDNPVGIAVDDLGYVYVADTNNGRVQVFTRMGTFIGKWDTQLSDPTGIAFNNTGDIYVADLIASNIDVFSIVFIPQLYIGVQQLLATNKTINVTFIAADNTGAALPDVLVEISNSTHDWAGSTTYRGQYNLTLAYTPNQFTLAVNASKSGYLPDNETFVIYIDPPAVDYTPPVDELDPSALISFSMFVLIFVGPWVALTVGQWKQRRKKNGE